jgi:hypothetical protein
LFSGLVWGYTVTLRPEEMIIEEPSFAKGYGGQVRTFARQLCCLEYAFINSEEISMVSPYFRGKFHVTKFGIRRKT